MRPRWADKPDANRAALVQAITAHGASWLDIRGPKGTPDGILGYRGLDQLVELKVAKGRLSVAQRAVHSTWRGRPVRVVRTTEEAQALLAEMRAHASEG